MIPKNWPAEIWTYLDFQSTVDPVLVFDWKPWGREFTAVAFLISNKGASPVKLIPEFSPDALHICTVGHGLPKPLASALTIPAGEASYEPFGIDLMAPYLRLWLAGDAVCDVRIFGIPRSDLSEVP